MNVVVNDRNALSFDQIRAFYEIEKSLAARLRSASESERRMLYQTVYEELYRQVPYHPMLTRKAEGDQARIERTWSGLRRFLRRHMTVLEVGAGDCRMAFQIAKAVKRIYGLEVSRTIADASTTPDNFELLISDGIEIPLERESVDLVFSDQLMEHLHPDDAVEQLKNIADVIKPGGAYICFTPHRLYGPTDVSKYFDDAATCFHLKEYTYRELDGLLRASGFSYAHAYVNKGLTYVEVPMPAILAFETLAELTFGGRPYGVRQKFMRRKPFSMLQRLQVIAYKAA